ncbi:hypothetical protein [Terribacillus halophilus]|jgi:hypothetical protein|uniref:hypothetical protein n=1 Tax=Terribacillus halophilus TaxID=361279 RepID=UPI0015C37F4D|nr:hypothetical protein [Terribacillus halophilus]
MTTLKNKNTGLRIVQNRDKRLASSRTRTNQLLERAAGLGLVDTYVDRKGRVRTKKEQ